MEQTHAPDSQPESTPDASGDPAADLPPSALFVLRMIEDAGPQTHSQLVAETRLPSRTVRYATRRLVESGLVDDDPYLGDLRKTEFSLSEAGDALD